VWRGGNARDAADVREERVASAAINLTPGQREKNRIPGWL